MSVFNIAEVDSIEVQKATFHKASDYKAVLLTGQANPVLLHKIQAEKLIVKKLATAAKDVKVNEEEPSMTTSKIAK